MSDKKCSVTVEVTLIGSTKILVNHNATFENNKLTLMFEEDGEFTVTGTEQDNIVQTAIVSLFDGVETTKKIIALISGRYFAHIDGANTCFGREGEVTRKIVEMPNEQKEELLIAKPGTGYFALKMILVGDTKISSKHPLIQKDKEVILVLTESAQFSIETTEKQSASIVIVGAGQPGTDTTGGVAGEMIEKIIELETGEYFVNIGNPKLHGKTTMASILDGSKYVFLSARSGTEMSEVLERKEFNICSIEHCNAVIAKGGLEIGYKIQDSPVGPGKITGINGRGYPMVNHVAVTCLITDDGITYGDYVEWIVKKAQKQAKENNMVAHFCYKVPPVIKMEPPDDKIKNAVHSYPWCVERQGELSDAKFGERYKIPMTWRIDFGPKNA